MRKTLLTIAAVCALLPAAIPQPAAAHAAWRITGYQYLIAGTEGVGTGGHLNSPATTLQINEGWTDDGIGSLTNNDPVEHTFTHCTSDCAGSSPKAVGALFDIAVPASGAASGAAIDDFNATIDEGTYVIFCRRHPSGMRARLRIEFA